MAAMTTSITKDDQAAIVHTRDRYFVIKMDDDLDSLEDGLPIQKMTAPMSADLVPAMLMNGKVWYSDNGLWVTESAGS